MILKEQLEILRGEPIREKAPIEQIPCIETSDSEKLCKHPVVSVNMITYNHEPYIRQAIEGVMMQQTDFEFELVIGEDASQDKTREICFEYQKKYPDKIRVLWSEENVFHLGGNSRRVRARSRGEFIALCEGDDYWTDPLKLQKQVDLLRRNNADFCVAFNKLFYNEGKIRDNVYVRKMELFHEDFMKHYFHTSTYLFSRKSYEFIVQKYTMRKWYDVTLCLCLSSNFKSVLLCDFVSMRRVTGTGIFTALSGIQRLIFILNQYIDLFINGDKKYIAVYAKEMQSLINNCFNYQIVGWTYESYMCYRDVLIKVFYKILFFRFPHCFSFRKLLRFFLNRLKLHFKVKIKDK